MLNIIAVHCGVKSFQNKHIQISDQKSNRKIWNAEEEESLRPSGSTNGLAECVLLNPDWY